MPVMTAADPAVPVDRPVDSAVPPVRLPAGSNSPAPAERLSDRVLALAHRHRRWVFLAILLLYLAGFNAQWRLEPDSGLYLSIGRNLAEGNGYTFHGKDHKLAYPGVPLLFYAVYATFGSGSLVPHLVLMWLMGLATLALTYRLFLLHAGRPTAVLVTLGVAISRVFYRYCFELLTDLPFLLGVMAFFVGYEAVFHRRSAAGSGTERGTPDAGAAADARRGSARGRWFDGVLLVAGLGLAVAARPAMLALVAAVVLAAAWSLVRGRPRWGHLVVVVLVVGAVAMFYLKDPRQQTDPGAVTSSSYVEEDQLFHLQPDRLAKMADTARGNVGVLFDNALARASFGGPILPGVNAALAAAVAVAGVLLVRVRPLWGMWVLATLLMVSMVPRPLDRYFLPTVPVLVYAWWTLTRWAEARGGAGRVGRSVFLVLFGVGAVSNVLGVLGFVYEQRYRPFLANYKVGRYASAYEAAAMIEQVTGPSRSALDPRTTWVFVPTKFARAMTLLARRYCVEPDYGNRLDPASEAVYALEPTQPLRPDADTRKRPTVRAWLLERGWEIAPAVLASVPNADPDDGRPWELHRVVPVRRAGEIEGGGRADPARIAGAVEVGATVASRFAAGGRAGPGGRGAGTFGRERRRAAGRETGCDR
jgi:hypothetical protein